MIDILGREEFTRKIFEMMVHASKKRQSLSFAIDGEWGVGKSFVLDMLCERLEQEQSEDTNTNRFMVFRYNSWEYDYYEEPIIAIVASMQDELVKRYSRKLSDKAKSAVKQVGVSNFQKIAQEIVKNKTGIDISAVFDGSPKSEEIDSLSPLRAAIEEVRKSMSEIAKLYTIVVVIDELDRCIPEYVIKVLNRCNHLFNGIGNIQLVYTINNEQIKHSVETIFGEGIDYKKYIKKFINNTFVLDSGTVGSGVIEKYSDYFDNFEQSEDNEIQNYIIPFINAFDINIRNQERIMERISLAHYSLYTNIKDPALLLFEVIVAFSADNNNRDDDIFSFTDDGNFNLYFGVEGASDDLDELTEKWRYIGIQQHNPFRVDQALGYRVMDNSMGRVLFTVEQLFCEEQILLLLNQDYSELIDICKRFWELYSISG